jgi:hypothetical protein
LHSLSLPRILTQNVSSKSRFIFPSMRSVTSAVAAAHCNINIRNSSLIRP